MKYSELQLQPLNFWFVLWSPVDASSSGENFSQPNCCDKHNKQRICLGLKCMQTGSMVCVVGASSLKKEVNAIHNKFKRFYESRVTATPVLMSISRLENSQNLLQKWCLAKERNLAKWYDIINKFFLSAMKNSYSSPYAERNCRNTRPLPTPNQWYRLLPQIWTPDVCKEWKTSGIPIMSVRKNLVSKRKQRDREFKKHCLRCISIIIWD